MIKKYLIVAIMLFAGTLYASEKALIESSNGVLLRSGKGTNYLKIKSIPNNSEIELIDELKESSPYHWTKIKYKNNTGYIFSSFIKKNPNRTSKLLFEKMIKQNKLPLHMNFAYHDKKKDIDYGIGSVTLNEKMEFSISYEAGGSDVKFLFIDYQNDFIDFYVELLNIGLNKVELYKFRFENGDLKKFKDSYVELNNPEIIE